MWPALRLRRHPPRRGSGGAGTRATIAGAAIGPEPESAGRRPHAEDLCVWPTIPPATDPRYACRPPRAVTAAWQKG